MRGPSWRNARLTLAERETNELIVLISAAMAISIWSMTTV